MPRSSADATGSARNSTRTPKQKPDKRRPKSESDYEDESVPTQATSNMTLRRRTSAAGPTKSASESDSEPPFQSHRLRNKGSPALKGSDPEPPSRGSRRSGKPGGRRSNYFQPGPGSEPDSDVDQLPGKEDRGAGKRRHSSASGSGSGAGSGSKGDRQAEPPPTIQPRRSGRKRHPPRHLAMDTGPSAVTAPKRSEKNKAGTSSTQRASQTNTSAKRRGPIVKDQYINPAQYYKNYKKMLKDDQSRALPEI